MLAKPEHEVAYQELVSLVNKHAGKLSAMEMLAVAANMLGKLVAMQDQRKVTPQQALKMIAANIEIGNKQVIDRLAQTKGNA
jgi:hypothetical protein